MKFKIEDQVEVPKIHGGGICPAGAGRRKYPFMEMNVGQSIFVPGESPRLGDAILQSIKKYRERDGLKGSFITRRVEGGVRVWRTA